MDHLTQEEQVFEKIKGILTNILGEDTVEIMPITQESQFISDLEMDSIQLVELFERVKNEYSIEKELTKWLSKQSFKKLVQLRVEDVVKLICKYRC